MSQIQKIPIKTLVSFSSELFFTIMQQIKCRNSKTPRRNNRINEKLHFMDTQSRNLVS